MFKQAPILVMDNVAFHKKEEIKLFLESIGVSIEFLPPYSPDLNPIEQVFSEVKSKLDKKRPRPRKKEELMSKIDSSFGEIGVLQNYFDHFWKRVNLICNGEEQ